jgi:hypothetical protein
VAERLAVTPEKAERIKAAYDKQLEAMCPFEREYQDAVVAEMEKRGGHWDDEITILLQPLADKRWEAWCSTYAVLRKELEEIGD